MRAPLQIEVRKCRSPLRPTWGFTIIEFLVASTLGLLVIGLALSVLLMNRSVFKNDIVRTKLNQNVRSAIDILSLHIRQSGESLDEHFPVILLEDGSAGAPDELTLRRNLFENEILNVCQDLNAGTFTPSILVAFDTTSSGCSYTTSLQPYLTTWNSHSTEEGGSATAYIFNRSSKEGEFFTYTDTTDDEVNLEMTVNREGGNWGNSYPGDGVTSAMYLIEELRFRLNDGTLQMIRNGDEENALNIVDSIADFQVTIGLEGGGTVSSFTVDDEWASINFLELTISAAEQVAEGDTIRTSITSQLFPRNILSH